MVQHPTPPAAGEPGVLRLWRLCRTKSARSAFSGEGARLYGGRWNLPGTALVYASSSLALAVLENLVHFDPDLAPDDYFAFPVEVPHGLAIETVELPALPRNWRDYPAPLRLKQIGSAWVDRGRTALLAVPSAIVPAEHNFLVNPRHPQFSQMRIGMRRLFRFDPRLIERA